MTPTREPPLKLDDVVNGLLDGLHWFMVAMAVVAAVGFLVAVIA